VIDLVGRLRAAGCVFAEDEARLLSDSAGTPDELAAMVARRVAGEPLEHVVGWVEFIGRRWAVDPGVFVPRQRSELLVRTAAAVVLENATILDLCCGCGALGGATALASPGSRLVAADIDPVAVACAARNLAPLGGTAHVGDLFAPLPPDLRGTVTVLLANVPYVPTDAVALMPPEARDHEPRYALDGGPDGLDLLRRVAAEAREWLAPGGRLLTETSDAQASIAVAVLESHGLSARVVQDDDLGATVVVARR
jgi:release factor glutamine methyltransferase